MFFRCPLDAAQSSTTTSASQYKKLAFFYIKVNMMDTFCFRSRIFKRYIFKLDNGSPCFIIYHYATILSSTK